MAKSKDKPALKTLRLKPGNHAFSGSHGHHNNDNTSSDEINWYLQHYPHIAGMIEPDEPEEIPAETKD